MKARFTVLLALVSLLMSCDKVPLTSPTGSTITLAVTRTSVPINGTIQVTAAVIEAGGTAVHDGTTVTFTGGLGTFNPIDAQTVAGIARTTYTGTTSGTVNIGAFSGAAKATEVEVKVGAAAAGSVSLQVVPPNVGQNGGSVSVTALVLDAAGNALPGVPVVFSTDVGTLSNANVISDSNGYAVTNLITTRQARVTARAGTATPAEFTVNVTTAPTVTITSSPGNPIAGQPVAFTITPSTAPTASPIQSVIVDFGDGQSANLGGITGPTGLTHTYNNAGGYTITARATDITGAVGISSTAIVVAFPALPTVSLAVAPNPIPPASNGFATITVTAAAATGGAPLRSVVVRKSDGTVIFSGSSGGTFAYQFTAGSGANPIIATVTDAAGITATATTVVLVQ